MIIARLLILSCLLSLAFISNGSAGIESWVDQDGVRHFSNVDTTRKGAGVTSIEEYKSDDTARKPEPKKSSWDDYDSICRQNPGCRQEMEKRERYEELQESNRRLRLKVEQEAKEKDDKIKKQNCEMLRKQLEKMRQAGWENYSSTTSESISCPDRFWTDSRGFVYDNSAACFARRNLIRRRAYERELQYKENQLKRSCGS